MTPTPTPLRNRILGVPPVEARVATLAARLPPDLGDRLPIGLCNFSPDGRLLHANPAAQRLLGQVLGLNETRDGLVARLEAGCAELQRLLPGGRLVVVAGGRLLEVESQANADGGFLWLLTDASAELRLRAQLAEEGGQLAHSHEAFIVIGLNGIVRFANRCGERERGYAEGELVGVGLCSLERPCGPGYEDPRALTDEELAARLHGVVRDGGVLRYNAWHRRRDGGELPVEASMHPHRLGSEQVVLLSVRDDSRRLMHIQALTQAKHEAETANRAKSAFLAITSHELRTPLTGIMGFCELLGLEVPEGNGDARSYLKLIADSSQSLLTIINDILDLSKIEARTLEIRPVVTDVEQLVDRTLAGWVNRIQGKGLILSRAPSRGTPSPVNTDPQRLRQMLDNLLSNAFKFTEQGTIELAVLHAPDGVEFTVTDSGCGISAERRDQLFTAFWQAADHHTRANGGNGLGLYISRSIAELLGGRCWLEATGSTGSVFKLRIPRSTTMRHSARLLKSDVWIRTPRGLEPVKR